jgi:hypothetical protein
MKYALEPNVLVYAWKAIVTLCQKDEEKVLVYETR